MIRPSGRPRKLPSREEVVRLYVECNLPTTEIARMFGVTDPHTVRTQLLRAGVKLRRHTVPLVCKIEGCGKPAVKIRHEALNCEYGTLCAEHRELHYRLLNRQGNRKRRNIDPARFNPWRLKEREEERKWLRNSKELLKQARLASLAALCLPGASPSPKKVLRLVTTSPE